MGVDGYGRLARLHYSTMADYMVVFVIACLHKIGKRKYKKVGVVGRMVRVSECLQSKSKPCLPVFIHSHFRQV